MSQKIKKSLVQYLNTVCCFFSFDERTVAKTIRVTPEMDEECYTLFISQYTLCFIGRILGGFLKFPDCRILNGCLGNILQSALHDLTSPIPHHRKLNCRVTVVDCSQLQGLHKLCSHCDADRNTPYSQNSLHFISQHFVKYE